VAASTTAQVCVMGLPTSNEQPVRHWHWAQLPALHCSHGARAVQVWVVPGSKQVEAQAIQEGIDKIFEEAGFQLRQPGCSACLGMNEDKIPAGKYCISTSNRNFEGRQGPNARTFLASPLTAALAALTGEIGDVREFLTEAKKNETVLN